MTSQKRDLITSHVLDQTTGRPAANIHATLTFSAEKWVLTSGKPTPIWEATTDAATGRIETWKEVPTEETPDKDSPAESIDRALRFLRDSFDLKKVRWTLHLETGEYWEAKGQKNSFYPWVEVNFEVNLDELDTGHWHIPVLLGPYGYTTYRGS